MKTLGFLGVLLEDVSKVNRNLSAFVRNNFLFLLNEHFLFEGVTWDGVYDVVFGAHFATTTCRHLKGSCQLISVIQVSSAINNGDR